MGLPKRAHVAALMADPAIAARWAEAHGKVPGDAEIDALYAVFVPLNTEVVSDFCTLIPGAVEMAKAVRARGMKLGSTTGYVRPIMERVLPLAKAQGYEPDNLVCAGDLADGRPTPLMMYRCFADLGVYPPATVVKIDDTEPGIARRAGRRHLDRGRQRLRQLRRPLARRMAGRRRRRSRRRCALPLKRPCSAPAPISSSTASPIWSRARRDRGAHGARRKALSRAMDAPVRAGEGDVNHSPRRRGWSAQNITGAARDLFERDAAAFLHQSVSSPCLNAIARAEGIWIEDVAGRRYMDFHGNNVHHIGYGHPRLKAAIAAQMDALPFAPRRFTCEPAVALAEKLGRHRAGHSLQGALHDGRFRMRSRSR